MTTTLITGANKGLGKETARQLVASGHTVYVGARDEARGREAADELGARFVQLDVTDDGSVAAAFAQIEADGGLDVLINNAGIEPRLAGNAIPAPADETADSMRATFETNVFGLVRVTHAFLPLLQKSAAPVIVNVSSGLASLTDLSNPESYTHFYPGLSYPGIKDDDQRDHDPVRQGVPRHPDQRRRSGLHQHRPQRPHWHPDRRGGCRDHRADGADRARRPDRHVRLRPRPGRVVSRDE